jgi:hypothetical protein
VSLFSEADEDVAVKRQPPWATAFRWHAKGRRRHVRGLCAWPASGHANAAFLRQPVAWRKARRCRC